MRISGLSSICAMFLVLSGCGTASFERVEPIRQGDVYKVIAEIKRQLSVYAAYQRLAYPEVIAGAGKRNCGNGLIGFDIVEASTELIYTSSVSGSVGIGASAQGVSAGVNAGGGTKATMALKAAYDVLPSGRDLQYKKGDLDNAPLAASMVNFWNDSLKTGRDQTNVCLRLQQQPIGSNTMTIGITVENVAGGNVKVGIADIGLSASGEFKSSTGNTIVVRFVPHDFNRPFPGPPISDGRQQQQIQQVQPLTTE